MIKRILNLGAGVQSTVVALMIHKGELPPIDAAIFADTGEEPQAVYRHLEWLIKEVSPAFPVVVRSAGKLGDGLVFGRTRTKGHTTIPAFTQGGGIVRRKCTVDYKINVIEQWMRRELIGLKPGQRWPKEAKITQIFGLSFEELGRAERVRRSISERNRKQWCVAEFPLIQLEMRRGHCLRWLSDYGVPHTVERSACVFCPYKSNHEWQRLKLHDAAGWSRAVEIDGLLRVSSTKQARGMKNPQFLHRSCVPLGEIDFSTPEERGDQGTMPFLAECEGMCGS